MAALFDNEFSYDGDGNLCGYGKVFPPDTTEVTAHLWLYKHDPRAENEGGRLTRWHHFRWVVDLLWNLVDSPRKVVWNEWTDKMLHNMIYTNYLGLAGCGSSGKSDSAAVYGIVEYLAYPMGTLILITSTTIKDAQKRVWKSVSELWNALKDPPGRMVYSKAMITGIDKSGKQTSSTGLQIVAAQKGGGIDDVGEMAGQKADQLILIADELPELSMAVLSTAYSNLAVGSKMWPFKMIAMGNPNLYTDPFGKFCEPVSGWSSITENDWEWETSRGLCLRFDASLSPNVAAGQRLYPWMPTREVIDMAKKDFGERSRVFYRMYKGFWFSDADEQTIYSESEIILSGADKRYPGDDVIEKIAFAGADPAYTQGGDKFPIVWGYVCRREFDRGSFLEIEGVHEITDDVTDTSTPKSYRAVEEFRSFCNKNGIDPYHFAYDATGAGISFSHIVVSEWSSLPYAVNFGGSASSIPVGPNDLRPGTEVYANRVTELWVKAKGLIREGLIYNIPEQVIGELIQRRWAPNSGRKLQIEKKVDMKKRTGHSPDYADAFVVLLEAIVRAGFFPIMEIEKYINRAAPLWNKQSDYMDIESASGIDLDYDAFG